MSESDSDSDLDIDLSFLGSYDPVVAARRAREQEEEREQQRQEQRGRVRQRILAVEQGREEQRREQQRRQQRQQREEEKARLPPVRNRPATPPDLDDPPRRLFSVNEFPNAEPVPTVLLWAMREYDRSTDPRDPGFGFGTTESLPWLRRNLPRGQNSPVEIRLFQDPSGRWRAYLDEGNHRTLVARELGIDQLWAFVTISESAGPGQHVHGIRIHTRITEEMLRRRSLPPSEVL